MKADEKAMAADKPKFQINSSYQGFADRQKNVFDQLNIMEHNSRNTLSSNEPLMDVDEPSWNEVDDAGTRREPRTQRFRAKESIFKRPMARAPRSLLHRKCPDYQVNPHKWTRYSLDVPSEDMSEQANKSAAMSFLKELESRKRRSEDLEDSESGMPHKIEFNKTKRRCEPEKPTTSASSQAIFRNSKLVMPEYVVGEKVKKEKKQKPKSESDGSTKEIKLDHLQEYEDE